MFQVEWGRFLRELGAEIPVLQDFAGEEVHFDGGKGQGTGRAHGSLVLGKDGSQDVSVIFFLGGGLESQSAEFRINI